MSLDAVGRGQFRSPRSGDTLRTWSERYASESTIPATTSAAAIPIVGADAP
jgi:hypothetical protein